MFWIVKIFLISNFYKYICLWDIIDWSIHLFRKQHVRKNVIFTWHLSDGTSKIALKRTHQYFKLLIITESLTDKVHRNTAQLINNSLIRSKVRAMKTKVSQRRAAHGDKKGGGCYKSPGRAQKRVLYIGNIQNDSRRDILRAFRFYGPIKRLWVSKCATYAFLEFRDPSDAHFARCRLNGGIIGGDDDKTHRIIVDWADIQWWVFSTHQLISDSVFKYYLFVFTKEKHLFEWMLAVLHKFSLIKCEFKKIHR